MTDLATSDPDDTSPAASTHASSSAANLSQSTLPCAALVPLTRILKFKAQMYTLLYNVQRWIQKSIDEEVDQIDKRVTQLTEQKIQVVYQRLDAF